MDKIPSRLTTEIESLLSSYNEVISGQSTDEAFQVIGKMLQLKDICDVIRSSGDDYKEYSSEDLPVDTAYDEMVETINNSASVIGLLSRTSGHSHALYRRKDNNYTSLKEGGTGFTSAEAIGDLWMGKVVKLAVIQEIENAVLMPKFDGCSCVIRFVKDTSSENFVIEKAQTRGRDIGFLHRAADITEKMKLLIPTGISGVEKHFAGAVSISVRGEVVLKDKETTRGAPAPFIAGKINGGMEVWKNALNEIQFIPFEITRVKTRTKETSPTQIDTLKFFKSIGLYKPEIITVNLDTSSLEYVKEVFEDYSSKMTEPLDGIVYCSSLWQYPRTRTETMASVYGKFAWKPEVEISTVLERIDYDIAKDGKIQLIAIYTPVKITGKTYCRAKLAISRLGDMEGLGFGSDITVKLIGSIVPFIDDYDIAPVPYTLPDLCPFCNAKLVYKEQKGRSKAATLTCFNINCIGANRQKMACFLKNISLKGVADKRLEAMGERLSFAALIEEYDLKDVVRKCLQKTTVREYFVGLNYGGSQQVEKFIAKTSLRTKSLFPVFACIDEISEIVKDNKSDFIKEIVNTTREIGLEK
jgi:NAD-dependent DNA ligase